MTQRKAGEVEGCGVEDITLQKTCVLNFAE